LKQQSTDEEALPASAQPEGVVKAEPLHSQSKSSDTIDVEEQALLAYADLAQLRKKKKQAYTMPSIAPTPCAGSIELRDSVDGKIALQPIKYEGQGTVHAKEESLGEQNAAAKTEPIPAVKAEPDPDDHNVAAKTEPILASLIPDSDVALDPIAQAAVNALKVRNSQKKAAAKQAALLKRPAGRVKTESRETVPTNQKRPAIPQWTAKTEKVPAVQYKGGVIYTELKNRKFRALRVRHDKYTEKSCSFKVKSKHEAWNDAVAAIDEHYLE